MNEKDEPTSQNNRDRNAVKGFMDYANGYYEGLKANQRVDERLKKSKGWVIAMLTNPSLSHAGENNPQSYPKVPNYTYPEEKAYSYNQIRKIQYRSLMNYVENNMLFLGTHAILADELYESMQCISKESNRIVGGICLHEGITDRLYGVHVMPGEAPRLLTRKVITSIISIVGGEKGTLPQISLVYVHDNIASITEVLKRLKAMKVENQQEKFAIEWLLNEMLWKMQNK